MNYGYYFVKFYCDNCKKVVSAEIPATTKCEEHMLVCPKCKKLTNQKTKD